MSTEHVILSEPDHLELTIDDSHGRFAIRVSNPGSLLGVDIELAYDLSVEELMHFAARVLTVAGYFYVENGSHAAPGAQLALIAESLEDGTFTKWVKAP